MNEAQSMTANPRYAAIDAARGLALVAMFVFHIIWDLAYFGLVAETLPQESAFRWFGHSIAAAFVGLSGFGLALSARHGLDMAHALRRIGLVAAAAALVSAATYAIFPEAFIFFGILHLIALASLCALPLLGAPSWLVGTLAAMALAAPLLISAPTFDAPIWWWLGLGTSEPRSNDWRPFLPWFGIMLTGLLAGRALLAQGLPGALLQWQPQNSSARALVFGGRHSLLVYLIHQPIFIALIFVISSFAGRAVVPGAEGFISSCISQCQATGGDRGICTRACGCIVDEAQAQNLWRAIASNRIAPDENEKFGAITRACVARHAPKTP
jgi:uncharacterized membrane protein